MGISAVNKPNTLMFISTSFGSTLEIWHTSQEGGGQGMLQTRHMHTLLVCTCKWIISYITVSCISFLLLHTYIAY